MVHWLIWKRFFLAILNVFLLTGIQEFYEYLKVNLLNMYIWVLDQHMNLICF